MSQGEKGGRRGPLYSTLYSAAAAAGVALNSRPTDDPASGLRGPAAGAPPPPTAEEAGPYHPTHNRRGKAERATFCPLEGEA